jgi:hypothetical protein
MDLINAQKIYSWGMKLTTYLHLVPRLRKKEREKKLYFLFP